MESTLTAEFKNLTAEVGHYLGYGRGADSGDTPWSTDQQRDVTRCVVGGLRKVYFSGHPWSFLKPVATLTLASGSSTVALPDDFGGPEGQAIVFDADSAYVARLDFGGIGTVRAALASQTDASGVPLMLCVEPVKGTTQTTGQRWQLRVYPAADQEYTIQVQYYLLPDYPSTAFPHVYGGAQHSQTFLAACLAEAESVKDDKQTVWAVKFQEELARSVRVDAKYQPQNIGYIGDRSDAKSSTWRREHRWPDPVTFDGVEYA